MLTLTVHVSDYAALRALCARLLLGLPLVGGVVVDEARDRVLAARVRLRAAHQVLQRLRGEALGAVAPGGGAVALADLSSATVSNRN